MAETIPKHPGGRPKKLKLDEPTRKDIVKLAGLGCSQREYAAWFEVTPPTWYRFREENPEVDELIEIGNGRGKIRLRDIQLKLAQKSATMAIHLGGELLEQRTRVNVEHSGGVAVEAVSDARNRLAHLITPADEPGETGGGS
jgi:hypothetical protein